MKFAEVKWDYSCKDCVPPKRHPGCHDTCPIHKAEKEAYQEKKAEAIKRHEFENCIAGITIRRFAKAHKQKLYEV